jgi:ParB-like chromosome segregation protein Spo0J
LSEERIVTEAEIVPINSIKPHPDNPRKGNVAMIAESLRVNGQYNTILVHRPTRLVIAGNHTWKAAKSLGWSNIAINWFDGTDAEALEVLLADNRSSDSSVLDDTAVYSIASSLPSLEGSGYVLEDLTPPSVDLSAYDPPEDPQDEGGAGAPDPAPAPAVHDPRFRLGPWSGTIRAEEFDKWRAHFPKRNSEALGEVLLLLGLVVPESPTEERSALANVRRVPLSELKQYPGNPNQGDVGLLIVLLTAHGQTRPIVVSERTNRILRGNHVVQAAQKLGWETIGAAFVDVDSDTEKRILLVDNRSSQVAGYDLEQLGRSLAKVGAQGIEVTGFTLGDLDDIIAGRTPKMSAWSRAEMSFELGPLKAKVRSELVQDLNLTPGQELREVAGILGLDPDSVTT